jgi:hypothetical protein
MLVSTPFADVEGSCNLLSQGENHSDVEDSSRQCFAVYVFIA